MGVAGRVQPVTGHDAQQCTRFRLTAPYWASCPAMDPCTFFLCEIMHYCKLCDKSTYFAQNECHELFRRPFNIQISVSIDFKTWKNENTQVPYRFWATHWDPPGKKLFGPISKDQRFFQSRKYLAERRTCHCDEKKLSREDSPKWKTCTMKALRCKRVYWSCEDMNRREPGPSTPSSATGTVADW